MYIELTRNQFLNIILGKTQYRKCPCCDNEGKEYWDETGEAVSPFPRPEWGDNGYEWGPCQNCDGLGYIPATLIQ